MDNKLDQKEIEELRDLLKRIESFAINDAGKQFIAQVIGTRRLIAAQTATTEALLKSQDESHREMVAEQRALVRWQKIATLVTGLMVLLTGIYAYETHAIVESNSRMAEAAQEQVDLMKQQIHETGRPRLFVDLSDSYTVGQFEKQDFLVQFEITNKSTPAAYNIHCEIRVVKNGKPIWSHRAGCRDTLFHDYADAPQVEIPADQIKAVLPSGKGGFSGIEALVTYEDASKGGSKFTSTRLVQAVESKPNGFLLKPASFVGN